MKRHARFSRKLWLVVGMLLALVAAFVIAIIILMLVLVRQNRSPFPDSALLSLYNSDSGSTRAILYDDDRLAVPAYTILQRQVVSDINAFLYLYTWEYNGKACLAIREIIEAQDMFGGWLRYTFPAVLRTTSKNCNDSHQYGFYVDRLVGNVDLSLVYGFADGAKRVEIHWQDGSVNTFRTINDTYMVVFRKETHGHFMKVNFLDSDDIILHTITSVDLEQ